MIIRSQGKTKIVNFDNVKTIEIELGSRTYYNDFYKVMAIMSDNIFVLLGSYDTEDIAKEVLEEIIKCVAVNLDIFDMPEE